MKRLFGLNDSVHPALLSGFLAEMEDGSFQIVEVKGDDKIDDKLVLAKQQAVAEMAGASQMEYRMLAGSVIMTSNVIDGNSSEQMPLPTV